MFKKAHLHDNVGPNNAALSDSALYDDITFPARRRSLSAAAANSLKV